jgi:hypothetical protein
MSHTFSAQTESVPAYVCNRSQLSPLGFYQRALFKVPTTNPSMEA